jgi:hypothetical protein
MDQRVDAGPLDGSGRGGTAMPPPMTIARKRSFRTIRTVPARIIRSSKDMHHAT